MRLACRLSVGFEFGDRVKDAEAIWEVIGVVRSRGQAYCLLRGARPLGGKTRDRRMSWREIVAGMQAGVITVRTESGDRVSFNGLGVLDPAAVGRSARLLDNGGRV